MATAPSDAAQCREPRPPRRSRRRFGLSARASCAVAGGTLTMRASGTSTAKHAGNRRKNFRGKLMRVTRTSKKLRPNREARASHEKALCRRRATIRTGRRSMRPSRPLGCPHPPVPPRVKPDVPFPRSQRNATVTRYGLSLCDAVGARGLRHACVTASRPRWSRCRQVSEQNLELDRCGRYALPHCAHRLTRDDTGADPCA